MLTMCKLFRNFSNPTQYTTKPVFFQSVLPAESDGTCGFSAGEGIDGRFFSEKSGKALSAGLIIAGPCAKLPLHDGMSPHDGAARGGAAGSTANVERKDGT